MVCRFLTSGHIVRKAEAKKRVLLFRQRVATGSLLRASGSTIVRRGGEQSPKKAGAGDWRRRKRLRHRRGHGGRRKKGNSRADVCSHLRSGSLWVFRAGHAAARISLPPEKAELSPAVGLGLGAGRSPSWRDRAAALVAAGALA